MVATYRERIVRYVVTCMKRKHYQTMLLSPPDTKEQISEAESIWAVEVFQELFQLYPKFVTLRMVMSVLRDGRVFEDTTERNKRRFGRRYRLKSTIADLTEKDIVDILLGGCKK